MAREIKKVPMGKKNGSSSKKKESSSKKKSDSHDNKSLSSEGHNKSHGKDRKVRRTAKPAFSRTILLVLLIVAASFFVYEEFIRDSENLGPVAAVVNGVNIYVSEVEDHFFNIPEEMRAGISEDIILDQIISQEVLVQEAKRLGITVSDEVIDEELDFAMAQAGWSPEEFQQILAAQGMTLSDLRDLYRVSIVIDELIQQEVLDRIEISEQEVEDFFEENKDRFRPSQDEVRASHILISTEQRSDEDALALAEDVLTRARDGEDFAELALEYSEDPSVASNMGDLNFFGRGMMVSEFEDAVFNMDEIGSISELVKTDFGYHIVKLTDKRGPDDEVSLDEMFSTVENELLNMARSQAVENYIMTLRDNADIEKKNVEEIDLPDLAQGESQVIEITEEDLENMQMGDDGMEVQIE